MVKLKLLCIFVTDCHMVLTKDLKHRFCSLWNNMEGSTKTLIYSCSLYVQR